MQNRICIKPLTASLDIYKTKLDKTDRAQSDLIGSVDCDYSSSTESHRYFELSYSTGNRFINNL